MKQRNRTRLYMPSFWEFSAIGVQLFDEIPLRNGTEGMDNAIRKRLIYRQRREWVCELEAMIHTPTQYWPLQQVGLLVNGEVDPGVRNPSFPSKFVVWAGRVIFRQLPSGGRCFKYVLVDQFHENYLLFDLILFLG